MKKQTLEERKTRALVSWKTLNEVVMELDETELKKLLQTERANKRRSNMITRIHKRLTKLRSQRELKEMVERP